MKKTIKERRLAVVKDAIIQLKRQKFVASMGTVCSLSGPADLYNVSDHTVDAQLHIQKYLKSSSKGKCHVCARGALLISTVNKENSTPLDVIRFASGSFEKGNNVDNRLLKLFSAHQLMMMENAFEVGSCSKTLAESWENDWLFRNYGMHRHSLSNVNARKAVLFGLKYSHPDERLIAIFKNVVKNDGAFKP